VFYLGTDTRFGSHLFKDVIQRITAIQKWQITAANPSQV
jgi:hypothetical protein